MPGLNPIGRMRTSADAAEPSSFRDPSGQVFLHRGRIHRRINRVYRPHYDLLIESGLYEYLVRDRSLVSHETVEPDGILNPDVYRIIRPETIPFVSYPYEWCFSQLRDAALLTLHIMRRALDFGLILKDASAFNIQFLNARPILIDTLSFEKYRAGAPWVAYNQFCRHFLAPLALMSYRDPRLNSLLRSHIDGLPLDLVASLLPLRAKLKPSLLTHLVLHSRTQQRFSGQGQPPGHTEVLRTALLGLIDSLQGAVEKLSFRKQHSEWSDYYTRDDYIATAAEHKETLVRECLDRVRPTSVWDFGANNGRYSRLAAEQAITTIAFDLDHQAVEQAYHAAASGQAESMLPLVLDLNNPSPGLGWDNRERQSLRRRGPADLVMALALIHHLAIGNNLPFERIADTFSGLGHWLLIEFVPKSDPQTQRLLISRKDIFDNYSREDFEAAFARHYHIRRRQTIRRTDRTMYLLERR